jgi:hypothetical protein
MRLGRHVLVCSWNRLGQSEGADLSATDCKQTQRRYNEVGPTCSGSFLETPSKVEHATSANNGPFAPGRLCLGGAEEQKLEDSRRSKPVPVVSMTSQIQARGRGSILVLNLPTSTPGHNHNLSCPHHIRPQIIASLHMTPSAAMDVIQFFVGVDFGSR